MKRNSLTTAVLAGLTGVAGMAGVANAVNVNPDGLGQVLLFPYYTARGNNDTLISIVNTTERGKAVKIRFIEALNSREVLDFNIYMSPYDVWVGAVSASGEGAKLATQDTTCTVPPLPEDGVDFLTFELDDEGPTGFERTASGYIEVIEMGTMLPVPSSDPGVDAAGFVIPWVTKHVNGEPRDCSIPVLAWTEGSGLPWIGGDSTYGFDTDLGASGGLFGSASIINGPDGTMFSYNATSIDGFWTAGTTNHTRPDSLAPNLAGGNATTSFVFDNGELVTQDWSAGVFAVNATMTYDSLMNEYVTDMDIDARTEWVLTFPTKRFHTDAEGGFVTPNNPIEPFTRTWHELSSGALNYSCEDLTIRFWDREEAEPTNPLGPPIFSPPPPPDQPDVFQLCRESNVIRFGQSGEDVPGATEILAETARADFPPLGYRNLNLPYDAGWLMIDLANVPAASPLGPAIRDSVAAGDGSTLQGLPVIGFGVTTYTNGETLGGTLANYGGTFNHRGSRSVTVSD